MGRLAHGGHNASRVPFASTAASTPPPAEAASSSGNPSATSPTTIPGAAGVFDASSPDDPVTSTLSMSDGTTRDSALNPLLSSPSNHLYMSNTSSSNDTPISQIINVNVRNTHNSPTFTDTQLIDLVNGRRRQSQSYFTNTLPFANAIHGLPGPVVSPSSPHLPLLASPRDLFSSLDFSSRPTGVEPAEVVLQSRHANAAAMTPPSDNDDDRGLPQLHASGPTTGEKTPATALAMMDCAVGAVQIPTHENPQHHERAQHQTNQLLRQRQQHHLQHLNNLEDLQSHHSQPDDLSTSSTTPSLSAKREPGLRLPPFEDLGIASPRPPLTIPTPTPASSRAGSDLELDGASTAATLTMPTPNQTTLSTPPIQPPVAGSNDVGAAIDMNKKQATDSRVSVPTDSPLRAGGHFIADVLTPPAEKGGALLGGLLGEEDGLGLPVSPPGRGEVLGGKGEGGGVSLVETEAGSVFGGVSDVVREVGVAGLGERALGAEREAGSDLKVIATTTKAAEVAEKSWAEDVIEIILSNLTRTNTSLSVLSHALPSPSPIGFIFPEIVKAIHHTTPGADTVWVNLFHAMPGRFSLADMPTSPPATPAAPGEGEDYFTAKTFDSAVTITDYQNDLSIRGGSGSGSATGGAVGGQTQSRSPRPVVRPSSLDLAIVERYIPPTNTNEFATLFTLDSQVSSLLVDRLIELNPHTNGTLLFIYPTREGGEAFMRSYLSPVLDPALRTIALLNNFPANFSRAVGTMSAVNALPRFEEMEAKLRGLCERLSEPEGLARKFLYQPQGQGQGQGQAQRQQQSLHVLSPTERNSSLRRQHRRSHSSPENTRSSGAFERQTPHNQPCPQPTPSSSQTHQQPQQPQPQQQQSSQQHPHPPPPPQPASKAETLTFTLLHARRAYIHPPRTAWSQHWWAKQEKSRIRSLVAKYAGDPNRRVDDAAATSAGTVQRLVDEVAGRRYPVGMSPYDGDEDEEEEDGVAGGNGDGQRGFEVGVFVIRKGFA